MKTEGFHAKIRCNLNDISYLSETQKNNFQFLNENYYQIPVDDDESSTWAKQTSCLKTA